MDKKDRKILHQLDKDSRMTYAQIGRNTRISQETVRYRMKRLESEVITHYPAFVNAPKLGYTYFQLMFKLHNINRKKLDEFLDHLEASPQIGWVGELEGAYDIALIAPIKGQLLLQRLIDDIYKKYSEIILKKTLSINLAGTFLPRDYLIGKEREMHISPLHYEHDDTVEVSETEERILHLLAQNARTPAADLARQLDITTDTAISTMRRLKEENILLGNYMTLNQEALGQTHHKVLVYLNNLTTERQQSFENYVQHYERATALIRTLGEHDYEIDVEVESPKQLSEFVMDLNNKFSMIIRDYSTVRIASMPKYTIFPQGR